MPGATIREEWATRRERGALPLIRLSVWIVLRIGRTAGQAVLLPVCAYFFLFSLKSRVASLAWLARALGRRPALLDRWRHFRCFATCLIDRVLLLNGRVDLFDVALHGEAAITAIRAQGGGCFLFGAHVGSFEVVRAVGHHVADAKTTLVMYEENARKTNAVLHAVNPALAMQIIGLGKPGSMLAVRDRLDDGHLVGILADRSLESERRMRFPFLGAPARFPVGPFRMAAMLGRPVVLMLGLYRGGRRYDIVFEVISDKPADEPIEDTMRRYVERLEHHCRAAPSRLVQLLRFLGVMQGPRLGGGVGGLCRLTPPLPLPQGEGEDSGPARWTSHRTGPDWRISRRLCRPAGCRVGDGATHGRDADRAPCIRNLRRAEIRADPSSSRCNLPAD